jgi:hypothetical protein
MKIINGKGEDNSAKNGPGTEKRADVILKNPNIVPLYRIGN